MVSDVSTFHHSSPGMRSSGTGLKRMRLIPPLLYSAFVDVALALEVECIFAQGEADNLVAAEAAARGGFIVAKDSDFVIYGSQAEDVGGRERGYIPVDAISWTVLPSVDQSDEGRPTGDDDDGFQVVHSKPKSQAGQQHLTRPPSPVPPFVPHPNFLASMTCLVYTPALLAASLQLPVRLLPLFGSLAGNDYVNYSKDLQHRGANAVEKVERVARCLREALIPKKGQHAPEGLTELIDRALDALLVHTVSETDRDAMIHHLIESAILYTLDSDHPAPLDFSPTDSRNPLTKPLYLAASIQGDLAPNLCRLIRDGSCVAKPWLEDVTRRSTGRIASEGVRAAWVAVLNESLGVGWVENVPAVAGSDGEDLHPEREAEVEGGDWVGDDDDAPESDISSQADSKVGKASIETPATTEFQGTDDACYAGSDEPQFLLFSRSSSTITAALHPILPLAAQLACYPHNTPLSPRLEDLSYESTVVAQPLDWRVRLHCALLGSHTSAVLSLPDKHKPLAAAVRSILSSFAEEGDKLVKERLRRGEVEAIVLASVRSINEWTAWIATAPTLGEGDQPPPANLFDWSTSVVEITNRNVQVSSLLLHTLLEADFLRQALLVPGSTLPRPHGFYSGRRLHALLNNFHSVTHPSDVELEFLSASEQQAFQAIVDAILDDEMQALLGQEPEVKGSAEGARAKKDKKKAARKARLAAEEEARAAGGSAKRGFELLGEVDA